MLRGLAEHAHLKILIHHNKTTYAVKPDAAARATGALDRIESNTPRYLFRYMEPEDDHCESEPLNPRHRSRLRFTVIDPVGPSGW